MVLSFVGTVCERKGLVDLRDALVRVRGEGGGNGDLPFHVVIVGDGAQEGPGAFERVKRAYEEAGLASVEFLGAVDGGRVREVLARTSVFCLPSHSEGFPLALLEAMAAGAAVVASSVGDVPRILDGGRAGLLIEPHDRDALAGVIDMLARSSEERARLGRAARERVEREFSQDRTLGELWHLYVRVAAERSARRR